MSESKNHGVNLFGLQYWGRSFQRNFAPSEDQTETVTPVQLDLLTRFLGFCLPKIGEPNLSTPHQSWLEGYQAGFQFSSENRRKHDHFHQSSREKGSSESDNGEKISRKDTQSAIRAVKSFSLNTPNVSEQHPTDSYPAGRTGSVSGHACDQSGCVVHDGPAEQEERHDCGSFPSPTDAELRQHGCPALVEPRARTFLCQLPDSDLAAINAGVIPTPLMKMMGRVAYDELERRWEAENA